LYAVLFYKKLLSDSEITDLYNSTNGLGWPFITAEAAAPTGEGHRAIYIQVSDANHEESHDLVSIRVGTD
ncbi:MAG: hypothetical protein ACXABY_21495, partial [Candidatus Thorarchaeota archaeon]